MSDKLRFAAAQGCGSAKTNDKVKFVGHRALLVYCSRAQQSDLNDSFSPRPIEEPVFSAVGNDSIA
jgi:hypothetical protein